MGIGGIILQGGSQTTRDKKPGGMLDINAGRTYQVIRLITASPQKGG